MTEVRRPWGLEAQRITHGAIVDVPCPACGGELRADDRFELIRYSVGLVAHHEPPFWSTTCTHCARRYNYRPEWRRLVSIQEFP
jgi:uncharacterized protein with PIN domain